MSRGRPRTGLAVLTAMIATSGLVAADAGAHAHVSPSVVQQDHSETYTLVVPTEGTAATSSVELTVPDGFQIGSFEAERGWKRSVQETGSGDEAVVSKVTWSGGDVPEGEAAYLRFQGSSDKTGDYAFKVRQTYSDGKVVDWAGPESSEAPAPSVSVVESIGGGGGDDGGGTTATIALIAAIVALLLGLAALARGSGRSLT